MTLDHASADELRSALATVAAIPVTPFGPDGQVDWDAHGRVIRRMVDAGVGLITPNGNTGEFYALTAAEARRVTESAVAAAGDSHAGILAGVGHDLPSAIEAARHASDNGVRMIMVHQPVGPYVSAAGWLEYHRVIAGALPDLGVVLYIRDPRIGARHIRLLGDLCPNVIAVKYGIRDPVQFAGVARDAGLGQFTWLAGLAELTAPACWTAGARGFTSGLVNVAPGLALSMLDALRGGDMAGAMKAWEACRPFEELRAADSSADNVSVVKEALAQLGLCRPDVRPPSHRVSEEVRGQIAKILAGWGLPVEESR
ncbi:MAG TPA: dihydrodipicolinate synthase family protein [Streptosporangiaceae bacterium]|nr:dihydrodipicolinate synthase family protein [Streptosporangiaceae bacterium]